VHAILEGIYMNKENLHELINRYEDNIEMIYNDEHDELFKWKAMKVWRDEWFKPDSAFASFADRFNAAKREFSLFIDTPRIQSANSNVDEIVYETIDITVLRRGVIGVNRIGYVQI
jgi:hypothetical protein